MSAILKWFIANKIVSIVLAALLVFGVVVGFETFSMSDESKVLVAELNASKAHEKTVAAQANRDRAAADLDLAAKDVLITGLRADLTVKDGIIGTLTVHQTGLETVLANAKTDAERVPILIGLVSDWTAKFNLADSKCKDYAGIVFNLNVKLADKDVIIGTWKSQYDAIVLTEAAGDKALASVRADLRRAKFWSTVKSGVIVGAAIVFTLKLLGTI